VPSCARVFGVCPGVGLYPFPARVVLGSPWQTCCAKPAGTGTAVGVSDGLEHGELVFQLVGQRSLVGRFFPQRKRKFGSTGPDSKLADRDRQENRQRWAARSWLPGG